MGGSFDLCSGLDQAAPDGIARELDASAHLELLEDVGAMTLDRLGADEKDVGDLPAAVALGDQLDHLLLARRERVLAEGKIVIRAPQQLGDERRHRPRVEKSLAPQGGSARLDQV